MADWRSPRSLLPPIVIGFGVGGFFDGIVLHQVLQWHHVVSTKVPPSDLPALQLNTLADGIFHGSMWLITVLGIVLLTRELGAQRQPGAVRRVIAAGLIGFGAFNVTDEIVFHALLDLHHIRHGPDYLLWDLAFAAWGVAMIAIGWRLLRQERTREA